MMKPLLIVALFSPLLLAGCAPIAVGALAGAAAYHYEKCYRWVDTARYGPQRINVCRRNYRR